MKIAVGREFCRELHTRRFWNSPDLILVPLGWKPLSRKFSLWPSILASLIRHRRSSFVFGSGCDLERTITIHLFVISPNNRGATFLKKALATNLAAWNLRYEGQTILGFTDPATHRRVPQSRRSVPLWLWGAERRSIDFLTDPGAYD